MSDITAAFRDHLKTESTVTDLVGTRVRTRWAPANFLRGSDGRPRSYIVISKAGGQRLHHQNGVMSKVNPTVEVYCIAGTRGEANRLSTAVTNVLDARPKGIMGRKNLVVRSVILPVEPRELDEPPQDGSDDWVCKDLLEFDVWHEQKVPVYA